MQRNSFSINRQDGVVLIISLIMLLLLTIIGLASSQVNNLEEKMAGNAKDQNLAFQSAEDALRSGEQRIEAASSVDEFNGNKGLLGESDSIPDYFALSVWENNQSVEFSPSVDNVIKQPRYFIKFMGESKGNGINVGDKAKPIAYFMVYASGFGAQKGSQIFLKSFYAKRFN